MTHFVPTFSIAHATLAPFSEGVGVRGVVLVALRAVSLLAVNSAKVFFRDALSIFTMGNRLQMRRVHAMPNTTQVVDLQPLGDGADTKFVSPAMGRNLAPASIRSTADTERAVPARVTGASPQPAVIEFDLRPETQSDGDSFIHGRKHTTSPKYVPTRKEN